MSSLFEPETHKWWGKLGRIGIHSPNPDNLLQLLEYDKRWDIDDLTEGCRAYGLLPSAWEYMWEYIRAAMLNFNEASMVILPTYKLKLPIRLNENWRWNLGVNVLCELEYIVGPVRWSLTWPITTSAVLLSTSLNPVEVLRFCEACRRCSEWCFNPKTQPDMRFPYERDLDKAYYLISAGQIMRKLAE